MAQLLSSIGGESTGLYFLYIEGYLKSITTSEGDVADLPRIPLLEPNWPNPFNPKTTLRFVLPEPARARLSVYGTDGRLVTTIAEGFYGAGPLEVTWNGRDGRGREVAPGVYLARLEAGSYSAVRKMTLVK